METDERKASTEVVVLTGKLRRRTLTVEYASGFHPELVRKPAELDPGADAWIASELARLDGCLVGVYGELNGNTVTITGIWPEQ